MDKVSIIIPVYNRALMVKEALNAALNQTYKNIEIIVVDDGSTDNTLEVLEEVASLHSNIRIINQKNQGVAVARQVGLENASGDYIIFLDSDDLINNICVEELLKAQKTNEASVTLARRFQKLNNFITLRYRKYPTNFEFSQNPGYLPTLWVGVTSKMFKKEDAYIADYGLNANEDLAYIYNYLAKKDKIACSNKAIYIQRFAPNSLARDYIYGNLDHIDNTIRPLEIEYNLFVNDGLLYTYYAEIEAIFIKNIMERVVNIKQSKETKEVQERLIGILLTFLSSKFPNWRQNKYLKNHFKGFPFDSFFYVNLALPIALKTKKIMNKDNMDTVEMFNRTLRKG